MDIPFHPMERTVVALAQGASTTQRKLDAYYWAAVRQFGDRVEDAGIPLDDPMLQAALPSRLQLVRTEVEAQMALELRRERGFEVAARLNGMVVCSFFEARYGSTETRRNRLSLEVVSVPRQPNSENNKQPQ